MGMMVCLVCNERISDPNAVVKHMKEVHEQPNYLVVDENYHDLPVVKATHTHCKKCFRSFPKAVLYRLHIKNKHEGVEPPENLLFKPVTISPLMNKFTCQ